MSLRHSLRSLLLRIACASQSCPPPRQGRWRAREGSEEWKADDLMMVMKHNRTYMIVINNNREPKIVINIFFFEWHCKSAEGSWFSHRTPPATYRVLSLVCCLSTRIFALRAGHAHAVARLKRSLPPCFIRTPVTLYC